MGAEPWVWIAVAVVLALLAWAAWTAVRLSRLEGRVARARAALETQLQRRAALAADLAAEHARELGEERARALARAAADALSATGDREAAENALGRELRDLAPDLSGIPSAVLTELAATRTRVALARRFYNDAVRDTQALRRRRLPRLLRVHAGRPLPRYFDIDDRLEAVPTGAGSRSADRP
ncbi:hypothetical protein [Blastococcus sp. CCUG 61487]|uniref:hypothetical protein n=1 Tax=Blastococcus sp. CCUG 61487 TaxID=1840703 RepID=UPI0010C01C18|nr:hypothetical protein [Blastococcus sp. CCUG 61487]TKJ16650.1 hypothetical protein A6V29_13470 [Blastococcus sp. CCUG 61487]